MLRVFPGLLHGTLLILNVYVLIISSPFMFQLLENWSFVLEMRILPSGQLHLWIEGGLLCSLGQYYVLPFLPTV